MRNAHTGLPRAARLACCLRCAGPEGAALRAHRQLLRAAVFPALAGGPPWRQADGGVRAAGGPRPTPSPQLPRVVTGTVQDVSPQVLVVGHGGGEERLILASSTAVWRTEPVQATALRVGEPVVVRVPAGSSSVAGKIWAGIGRVTGTIVARTPGGLLVDEGVTRRPQAVIISPSAESRIRVRIPEMEPGSLIDVIGLRLDAELLEAHLPATAQPAYLAGRVSRASRPQPPRPQPAGRVSGCVTWREPACDGDDPDGVAYPAIDPAARCAEGAPTGQAGGVMPYLAVGSRLLVRNDCTMAARVLSVTGCGAAAALFQDRCQACGVSPRGRVAELGVASFVSLGGELERGCFNATIDTGW